MLVRAIKRGFLGGRYRRVGDKFDCPSDLFSSNWMEEVTKDMKPLETKPDYTPLECPSIDEIRAKRESKEAEEIKKTPKKRGRKPKSKE